MLRLIAVLAGFIVISYALLSFSYAQPLVIGVDDWCPYICLSPSEDSEEGYVIDIITSVLNRAGYQTKTVEMHFKRQILYAKQGEVHIVVGLRRESAPFMLFTMQPFGIDEYVFFVGSDSAWAFDGLQSLRTLDSVGIPLGYSYSSELSNCIAHASSKFVQLAGQEVPQRQLQMLHAGRLQAIIAEGAVGMYYAKKMHIQNRVKKANSLETGVFIHIGVSSLTPNAEEIVKLLDEGLIELRASGELDEILARYGLDDWE